MTSEITVVDGDDVMEVGVRLPDIRLTYDENEEAYLGEGDLVHTRFSMPLGESCWIKQAVYRSDRFYIRLEVDEYFDAAPDVRLYMRMRGTTAFTMPGEGALIACLTGNDTTEFSMPASPIWAAGWFVIRDDLGEEPAAPHGWPIRNIVVEGWEITGIEDENFRIYKELDHTYTEPDGEQFREVATYEIEPCMRYETVFEMGVDSYTFANKEEIVWPESYWSQFDYSVEGDAFTTVTGSPPAHSYPDWYAYVRAFGEQQTYHSMLPKVQRPLAMLRWKMCSREFWGACYGFTYSSLLHHRGLRSALPQPLGMLTPEDIVLEELHEKHCYQLSREGILHTARNLGMRPKQMIETLVASLREDEKASQGLGILLPGLGHSVLPLSITRCIDRDAEEVLTEVEVWDNDDPGAPRKFTVNETRNLILGDNGNLDRGFFPDVPADEYQPAYPTMFKGAASRQRPTMLSGEWTEVFYKGGGSATMTVPGRQAVDLNTPDLTAAQDMFPVNILTGARPIIPGYNVASEIGGSLRVDAVAGAVRETVSSISARGALDAAYSADAGSQVSFTFDNVDFAMQLSTTDALRDLALQLVLGGEEADLLARIGLREFPGRDSLQVALGEAPALVLLRNAGEGKTYSAELMRFGTGFATSGAFADLTIERGETHGIVAGSTDSLRTTQIALHIDRGSDGSVDEIRILRGYGTVSVDRPAVVHEDLRAWPAPWNPTIRPLQLRYALLRPSTARLVVYNALQQEIAELVPSQMHEAGTAYHATWDGTDRTGRAVPVGTYFYVLEAADGSRALGKTTVLR
ncbi:MAG: hypothetical protein RRA94_06545 [Bacteroidota bacterium]|nr:hypothetical protein [Bacteroidota bacterium]